MAVTKDQIEAIVSWTKAHLPTPERLEYLDRYENDASGDAIYALATLPEILEVLEHLVAENKRWEERVKLVERRIDFAREALDGKKP